MTREEILSALAETLEEVAGVDPEDVTEDKTFVEDLDVDSLSMIEVVVSTEEKFDIRISDDEFKKLKTVSEVVSLIELLLADKAVKVDDDLSDK